MVSGSSEANLTRAVTRRWPWWLVVEAYRIHGLMAHVAVGIGWAVAGVAEALRPGRPAGSRG